MVHDTGEKASLMMTFALWRNLTYRREHLNTEMSACSPRNFWRLSARLLPDPLNSSQKLVGLFHRCGTQMPTGVAFAGFPGPAKER